ncbi:MAG: PhnD/SsuA/transferrin family substrate-binding protein [Candidatus Ozemobacteraceae bacterium]
MTMCRGVFFITCALAFVAFFTGCGNSSSQDGEVKPIFAGERPLTFGVFPFRKRAALLSALKPLTEYLSHGLAAPIRVRLVLDYDELENLVRHGDLDLAWCAPRQGVATPSADSAPLQPVCRPESANPAGYHGLILVKATSQFLTLADLKDRVFTYVDRQSNSGFVQPNVLLCNAGLHPLRLFKTIRFAGNHDKAVEEVLTGLSDAAAVSDIVLHNPAVASGMGTTLRVIATTAAILPDPILVAREVGPDFPSRVAGLLIEAENSPEGRVMLASLSSTLGIKRFVPLASSGGSIR